jgi:excisionase family DNA binding protein
MNTQTQVQLVSRGEAARILGVSRDTIKRLSQRGELTEIRFTPTSHPRFRLEDVYRVAGRREAVL